MNSVRAYALLVATFFFSGLMQLSYGEATAKLPHGIDSKAIDQGIAFVLMLVGLLVTYLVH